MGGLSLPVENFVDSKYSHVCYSICYWFILFILLSITAERGQANRLVFFLEHADGKLVVDDEAAYQELALSAIVSQVNCSLRLFLLFILAS